MSKQRHREHLSHYLKEHKNVNAKETLHRLDRGCASPLSHGDGKKPGTPILRANGKKGEDPVKLQRKSSITSQSDASQRWSLTHHQSPNSKQPTTSQQTCLLKKMNQARPKRMKMTINNMPKELLLRLLGYLNVPDILAAGQVCSLWRSLADDNLLWQRVYTRQLRKVKGHKAPPVVSSPPPLYWKSLCLRSGGSGHHQNVTHALKKTHPFTGLPSATKQLLQNSDMHWYVGFVDESNKEIMFKQSDFFFFSMSMCVRWYSIALPSGFRIKQLHFYAATPVFFDEKGHGMHNSPRRRSLLCSIDLKASPTYGESSDGIIVVNMLPQGVMVARWVDGGEVAFLTVNFHLHQFVEKCLHGSSKKACTLPIHQAVRDDIDSSYGLHGYSCTLELRNQRKSFWSEQYRSIYCRRSAIAGNSHAVFVLIDPSNTYSHPSVEKRLSLLWKTDALHGMISDFCILDLTLLDEHKSPIWCFSNGTKLTTASKGDVSYATDGEPYEINYIDNTGELHMLLVWEEESKTYHITKLEVHIALCVINRWFGRHY
ncbi:F-box only protein 15 [Lamellibrachia satsuma]|nr:F-box only protein 15 [Lamellibrachia satsuma]